MGGSYLSETDPDVIPPNQQTQSPCGGHAPPDRFQIVRAGAYGNANTREEKQSGGYRKHPARYPFGTFDVVVDASENAARMRAWLVNHNEMAYRGSDASAKILERRRTFVFTPRPRFQLMPPNDISISRRRPTLGSGSAARRLPRLTDNRRELVADGVPPLRNRSAKARSAGPANRPIVGLIDELG